MTQAARPQTPWLVPPGDMTSFGRSSFTVACRGHEKMGEVLSYFVYEASWQAKNEGIDIQSEDCTFITVQREQKQVLSRVATCQKSLIAYIRQLEAWGFLIADGYHHTYQVHFRKINEAITSPPEIIKKKPRGKYAPAPSAELQSEKRHADLQSQAAKLQSRYVKIQSEMVKIQTRMVNLQSQMVKIQSSQNAESTPGQDLEGILEPYRILLNLLELQDDSRVASVSTESDGAATFLSQLQSFDETLEEIRQNGKAPLDVSPHKREGHSQEEPVVKSADTSLSSGPAHTSAHNDITSQEEALQGEIPTQVALLPAVLVEPTKTPPTPKTDETGESKKRRPMKECSPEIQARRRTWQDYYNQRRGGPPRGKGACIDESNCNADLIDEFTDAQIQAINRFVLAEIFPYKLLVNKHKVGARIIFDESQNARQVLKERGRWPSQDTKAGDTLSTDASPPVDKYVAEIRRRAAETAARNALQEVAL